MKLQSINPHDQSIVGDLDVSTPKDIESAVLRAKDVLGEWRETAVEQRCEYVEKLKGLLLDNKEKLAKLITMEMGKPLEQSRSEIDSEVEFIDFVSSNSNRNPLE